MVDVRSWPVGLRRLADVIGPAAAVKLADAFGGGEDYYIPKTAGITHPFVAVIGLDRMEDLCRVFGPGRIDIPRGTFKDLKKAHILEATGSARDVALGLRVTQRYVRQVRNTVSDPDTSQPSLFDD
jgi:hypothetical protein